MALAMARPWKHPKTGMYWLRKRVPGDLQSLLGKREEKVTLKTRDPAEAKRRHAASLAALEQRWTNLRAPVCKLDQAELHRVTVTTYERCMVAGTPGIIWDTGIGDNLWEDALDMGAAVQRNWCHQRAGEYAAAFGLRVDEDDLSKMAKAIGIGAQKAALALQRQAKGDFSPEGWLGASVHGAPSVSFTKPVAFAALLEVWAAEKQPTQKTIASWQQVLAQFCNFMGTAMRFG